MPIRTFRASLDAAFGLHVCQLFGAARRSWAVEFASRALLSSSLRWRLARIAANPKVPFRSFREDRRKEIARSIRAHQLKPSCSCVVSLPSGWIVTVCGSALLFSQASIDGLPKRHVELGWEISRLILSPRL